MSLYEQLNSTEEEIVENSIHISYLSTDLSIDEYIELIKSSKIRHVIVSDGEKIYQFQTEYNIFSVSTLQSGLFLYAYKNEDVL